MILECVIDVVLDIFFNFIIGFGEFDFRLIFLIFVYNIEF